MKNDSSFPGALILISIIGIALMGGFKNTGNNTGIFGSSSTPSPSSQQTNIQQQLTKAQQDAEKLKKQIEAEEAKKIYSRYKGLVTLSYINRGATPSQEYVVIRTSGTATTTINVTGWMLKSTSTGATVSIPKATYLYFDRMQNSEENIYLDKQDTLYLVTGTSPNGTSFKVNKCSGYLGQFQTFIPSLNNNCPLPRNENTSSIPRSPNNDACLDYIDAFPACRIQTTNLPITWSYECTRFIYDKINYSSCVNTHKDDKDFYGHELRVYLKRNEKIWKNKREHVILYDETGKIVDSLSY